MSDQGDDGLVRAHLGGDPRAFEQLYQKHAGGLFSYLRLEAPALAEDLLQETFTRVLRALPSYRPEGHFGAFLYRIGRNLVSDSRRRAGRETGWDEEKAGRLTDPTCPPDRQASDRVLVRQLLRELPEEQREVVVLRWYLDLTFADIARLTETPLGTVLARMHRAVDRLRKVLAESDSTGLSGRAGGRNVP